MRFLYKLGIHLAQSAGCWFPNAFGWFVLNDEHQQTQPRFPLPWTFHPDFARTSIPNCTTASNSRDSITGWLASSLLKVATTWEIVCKKMWTIWPSNLAPLGRSWVQMRRHRKGIGMSGQARIVGRKTAWKKKDEGTQKYWTAAASF